MRRTIEILEDNGGGLHLAELDGGDCVRFYSGLEQRDPGQLLTELADALSEGIEDAEGLSEQPEKEYQRLQQPYASKTIASGDQDTIRIYWSRMGGAGERFAGLS